MSLRSSLGLVRGLGSAKSGTHHWWMQRVTAVALVPLTLWLVISLIGLTDADYATAIAWFSSPLNAALMVSAIVAIFYHAQLGMQVVFEDYIHTEWVKLTAQLVLKFACILLGLMAAIAALKISFGA
jgi:succinate dehydrogenase / fumarate reductase, membrane anchor subunit